MKIDRAMFGDGFIIRVPGDRRRYRAESVGEVALAVEHYFWGHHDKQVDCPLCRAIRDEATRKERKDAVRRPPA